MPKHQNLKIEELTLDLDNYRTIHQRNEKNAINAMIAISPDKFWALMDSILEDGYHPTENVIVLQVDGKYVVKEGNRRIAAMKIIHGVTKGIEVPNATLEKIDGLPSAWLKSNSAVPCSCYKMGEAKTVDKIVSLIHAKGESAAREQWTTVARARYSRDQKDQPEPALDLLEKYLKHGKNFSTEQAERWSGDYKLTVLLEAIQKLYMHCGCKSVYELVKKYPKQNKASLDKLLFEVGMQIIGFKDIRNQNEFFGTKYGIKQVNKDTPQESSHSGDNSEVGDYDASKPAKEDKERVREKRTVKNRAKGLYEPRSVYRKLRSFWPHGNGREKVVALLEEVKRLKIDKHPHAFCFLLRSMFEISAKAYCNDHQDEGGPSFKKKNGYDKNLVEVLRDVTKYMTVNNTDKEMTKALHGAMTELGKPEGLLSVTSFNQLVSCQRNDRN